MKYVLCPSDEIGFEVFSTQVKRQLRKSIALPNINTDNEAQINAKVDKEAICLSIKI